MAIKWLGGWRVASETSSACNWVVLVSLGTTLEQHQKIYKRGISKIKLIISIYYQYQSSTSRTKFNHQQKTRPIPESYSIDESFDQQLDFYEFDNRIKAKLWLPTPTNQSLSSLSPAKLTTATPTNTKQQPPASAVPCNSNS